MKLHVLLFAAAKEATGEPSVSVDFAGAASVGDLRVRLLNQFPDLGAMAESLHIAVNGEFAGDDRLLQETDEVACFPPVSGG